MGNDANIVYSSTIAESRLAIYNLLVSSINGMCDVSDKYNKMLTYSRIMYP